VLCVCLPGLCAINAFLNCVNLFLIGGRSVTELQMQNDQLEIEESKKIAYCVYAYVLGIYSLLALYLLHMFLLNSSQTSSRWVGGSVINIYTRTYYIAGIVRWAVTEPGTPPLADGF